jgi:predicted DNA-binding transcriptional regulator AlpA
MPLDATESASAAPRSEGTRVLLSKWVNERSPAWHEILSAHDVARLTRRRRWILRTLTFLGKFPKRQRFHDRAIGWAKHDVLKWLAESAAAQRRSSGQCRLVSAVMLQRSLPMHFPRTRRGRGLCSKRRKGGGS